MKTEHIIWLLVMAVGGGALAIHTMRGATGVGTYAVNAADGTSLHLGRTDAEAYRASKAKEIEAARGLPGADEKIARLQKEMPQVSFARTMGIWIAAFLTLACMSFLYRDNPVYRFAEHVFIGVSAAYWMSYAFWDILVPNALARLLPRWTKFNMQPGLDLDEVAEDMELRGLLTLPYDQAVANPLNCDTHLLMSFFYAIPLILGMMLLWRLAPKGQWIARWPLAYIIGITAGLRLPAYLQSDVVAQIGQTILPLFQMRMRADQTTDWLGTAYDSANNILTVLGTTCVLIYFFFSLEHRGLVGRASRVGIWILMITFGAGFGYTVMGRITLLLRRFEFLCNDWLAIV